eukprot:jgi/Tetstr1/428886/TSEL_018865.t1
MDVATGGLSKLEMDLARKAGHMLTGQHDSSADGAATSSTMADLEAMFSRILEKSQAAHGGTGAMRLAVEVPDRFLDCVDTDDHGTCYMERRVWNCPCVSCVKSSLEL